VERTGGKSAGSQGDAERAVEEAVRSYLTPGTPTSAPTTGRGAATATARGGGYFPANDVSDYGSPHTQLHCFGQ
jgi:hypothetical protein